MRPENWKIFLKNGSLLNTVEDPYIDVLYYPANKVTPDPIGYAITTPDGLIDRVQIVDGGMYPVVNPTDEVSIDYLFSEVGEYPLVDYTIHTKDISVFKPQPTNFKTITGIDIDDTNIYEAVSSYIYPSVTYTGALFLEPVSIGLIETEHLFITESSLGGFILPYDEKYPTLIARMVGDEEEIMLFTIDETLQEITWANEIRFTLDRVAHSGGLQINIGFRSEEEGTYERRLILYHETEEYTWDGSTRIPTGVIVENPLVELVINAQSIGQDERLDTLLDNFGLPKPKGIPKLFKSADINEDLPDWKLLNHKGKLMVLEHHNIIPYIGTYKALINAIKWLGYEDIKVKEWFLKAKENKKLSLYVPYDADERKTTIKSFSADERRDLKKLNHLSLVYCITRETGETDQWGTPLTENCYEYNLNEILIKLYALKSWLEKNIIGVNARIIDITGEGVYYERYRNIIYGTQNYGTVGNLSLSLTPLMLQESTELVSGEASVGMTLKEFTLTKIGDMNARFIDYARYGWDPEGFFSPDEWETRDPSAVFIGSPISHPFQDLYDIQWRLSVQKRFGVIDDRFVTNPLFVYDNSVMFYEYFDVSSRFFDISANVDVTIETGYLRSVNSRDWDEYEYKVYRDPDPASGKWILESSLGVTWLFNSQFSLQTSPWAKLEFSRKNQYKTGLFSVSDYQWVDASGVTTILPSPCFLDVTEGKISMDSSTVDINDPEDAVAVRYEIEFLVDPSIERPQTRLNVTYTGARVPMFAYDPSDAIALYYDPSFDIRLAVDNSTFFIVTNHIGEYNVEAFAWNGHNNLFFNDLKEKHRVWTKYPMLLSFIDLGTKGSLPLDDVSAIHSKNVHPIFDRLAKFDGISVERDDKGKPYLKIPDVTRFYNDPLVGSFSKVATISDKIVDKPNAYQYKIENKYQSFDTGDNVRIILYDKGMHHMVAEFDCHVSGVVSHDPLIMEFAPTLPPEFDLTYGKELYVINTTERPVSNITNNTTEKACVLKIPGDAYEFRVGQMVSLIARNAVTNQRWSSSYRVKEYSMGEHTIDGLVPEFLIGAGYDFTVKHAFSAYADYEIRVNSALTSDTSSAIYLNDTHNHVYYLDNMFVFANVSFEMNNVVADWYDPYTYDVSVPMYSTFGAFKVKRGTLVILSTYYERLDYVLGKRNIWTLTNRDTGKLYFRVHNEFVPYVFADDGVYDVTVETYDSYGNLVKKTLEGMITVGEENVV